VKLKHQVLQNKQVWSFDAFKSKSPQKCVCYYALTQSDKWPERDSLRSDHKFILGFLIKNFLTLHENNKLIHLDYHSPLISYFGTSSEGFFNNGFNGYGKIKYRLDQFIRDPDVLKIEFPKERIDEKDRLFIFHKDE
jgi:hypothetical protein